MNDDRDDADMPPALRRLLGLDLPPHPFRRVVRVYARVPAGASCDRDGRLVLRLRAVTELVIQWDPPEAWRR